MLRQAWFYIKKVRCAKKKPRIFERGAHGDGMVLDRYLPMRVVLE